MNNTYKRTKTTVSLIHFHFVFCPRYRRKIVKDVRLEQRFKELVKDICAELDIELLAIECDEDHTHLFLSSKPTLSPADIMAKIKGRTSKTIREEFSNLRHLPSLWTRSFFVSTAGKVSSETIKRYVEEQKNEGVKMSQIITVKVKLMPNQTQCQLLIHSSKTYISTINALVGEMVQAKETTQKTSKHVKAPLPSAVKNQAIRDAKSVFAKVKKTHYKIIPILKKPCILWNNQNYTFDDASISIPLLVNGKSKRIRIKASFTPDILTKLDSHKRGTLRITKKANKWIAQFSIEISTTQNTGTKIMGVDLGLKVPAVAVTDDGKTRFFGNGRRNKYVRRTFKSKRKTLGHKKKRTAIKKLNNKEQRWMKDQDHKVSRQIVDFATKNKVAIIRLEQLTNIRQTAKTSRKNAKNLHTWSFYRLASFIEYKAALAGIKVEYVDPTYTSQTCPSCGNRNKVKDRSYKCRCGYHTHRDRVGAMNIRYAPVIDGKSRSA